ncbi:TlpA family protein disulfide reductase [Thermodesulfobacteriota bacterium]
MHFNYLLKISLLTCLIMFLLFFGCNSNAGSRQAAPDFSLDDLSGKRVSLKQYEGYTVLLDFWATWCPPCRRSIPELVALQKKYRNKGLIVLGISLDNPRKVNNEHLTAFVKKFNINYPILRANQKIINDYFGNTNISIPTLFIVNQEGRIVDKQVGFSPGAVENSLKKLFK